MIVRYIASGVHLGRTQSPFYTGKFRYILTITQRKYSKYHAKIRSNACLTQVVLSLNGLPVQSYSVSNLTVTVHVRVWPSRRR